MLNFKITLPLAMLDMVGSQLVSGGLVFSHYIPVDIQLVIFLLLLNISELAFWGKTKYF